MTDRLEVLKTFKLYIDGKFPRSESGRTLPINDMQGELLAHVCRASRKDLRDAVEAARKAQPAWQEATPYLRGQILYRIAEMIEGKRHELATVIDSTRETGDNARKTTSARASKGSKGSKVSVSRMPARRGVDEVSAAIDRVVAYAGWADKYAQVLGCNNPVAGPHYNFTVPEPTGVVGVLAPDACPLLALVSLVCPAICAGNTVVALASERNPLAAAILAESCATGDVPGGVVNILTGLREELTPFFAAHREIDALHAANLPEALAAALRAGAAENVKRVTAREGVDFYDSAACESPWWIEPMVEMKTIWHPAGA